MRKPTGITLYQWASCPYCVRVKQAFDAMQLDYQVVETDDMQSEVYALLGARQVPAIHDSKTGVKMLESLDIIAYAKETYG